MSVRYTPGPWDFVAEDGLGCFVYTTAKARPEGRATDDDDIASVTWRGTHPESVANARLIASSPRLLEALRGLIRALPESWGDFVTNGRIRLELEEADVDAAIAAIREAEGMT